MFFARLGGDLTGESVEVGGEALGTEMRSEPPGPVERSVLVVAEEDILAVRVVDPDEMSRVLVDLEKPRANQKRGESQGDHRADDAPRAKVQESGSGVRPKGERRSDRG